jgi:hypothetical protein
MVAANANKFAAQINPVIKALQVMVLHYHPIEGRIPFFVLSE